ncbi:MAG: PAS domain S-box protein [Acidobacteria bacterium]|nr:PAS domain S-box protein [Acidobacteriota bacterium]
MARKATILGFGVLTAAAAATALLYYQSPPDDRVYRIGYEDNPPFHFRNAQGNPEGLSIDILNAAARRKGIRLAWSYHPESSELAIRSGRVDLWPLMSILTERLPFVYFSDPYRTSDACLVVRQDSTYRSLSDFAHKVINTNFVPLTDRLLKSRVPSVRLVPIADPKQQLEGVCRGEADAAYLDEYSVASTLMGGLDCAGQRLRIVRAPETRVNMAIGASFQSALASDALRDAISDMMNSGELASITTRWSYFSGRSMETDTALVNARRDARNLLAFTFGAFLLLFCTAWLAWRLRSQRNRALQAERALAASERYYHSLVDLIPDSLFVLNRDGSIRSAHPKGMPGSAQPGTASGPSQQDLFLSQISARHRKSVERVLASGAPVVYEEEAFPGIWMETRLVPVRDSAGNIDAIMGIAREITSRKLAEKRLAEQQLRLQRIMDATDAGYFRISASGNFEEVNQAWLDLHGYASRDEVIGRHFSSFQAPDDLAGAEQIVRDLFAGKPSLGEFSRRCKDGSIGYHSFSANAVWQDREIVAVEGFIIDTTQQRLAQQARVESEARYRALFNNMSEGVALHDVVYDAQGQAVNYRVVEINPRYEALVGLSRSQVLGRLATDAYGTPEPPYFERFIQASEHGRSCTFESYFPPLDRHFSIAVAPLGKGHFATIFTDITTRKRHEEERARLEDQLRQSQKMESIGRLAGGIAHDFNNILTIVSGYSSLLSAAPGLTDKQRIQVEQIAQAGARAADLTAQLLAFSRRQIVQPRPVNLNQIITESKEMFRRLIGAHIELVTQLDPALALVEADPGQIHQVLLNLVINARDAMPSGGTLRLETSNLEISAGAASRFTDALPGPAVLLSVSDSGEGMDEATLQRIFEPFFTTKGVGAGTGLGLSIVYGIVRQNHGWIETVSQPGSGTAFRICFPRYSGEDQAQDRSDVPLVPARGGESVLLVEDQGELRELNVLVLSGCGYNVLQAPNGAAALEVARACPGPIHLLLTDIIMPGMNGRELARRLLLEHPRVRVLFVTGYAEVSFDQGGFDGIIHDLLLKPFTPAVLAAKVREILDLPQSPLQ